MSFLIFVDFFFGTCIFNILQGSESQIVSIETIGMIAAMGCIYGLSALMTAANEALIDHNANGKFRCVQFSVLAMRLPSAICQIINIDGKNDEYSSEVMINGWTSFITIILMTLLSFGFVKYFDENDCIQAIKGMNQGNVKFSQSMAKLILKNDEVSIAVVAKNESDVEDDHEINDINDNDNDNETVPIVIPDSNDDYVQNQLKTDK